LLHDLFRELAPRLCMSCKEELKALGVIKWERAFISMNDTS